MDDPSLDIRDKPFYPPRFELRRLVERILANTGAVCIWTVRACMAVLLRCSVGMFAEDSHVRCSQGLWDQIDVNILPTICSYEACGNCTAYGTFPCAW